MIVISDTNILSSFAAAEELDLIMQLFAHAQIIIPPSVVTELQAGFARGHTQLRVVLQALEHGRIRVLALTPDEIQLQAQLPLRLNQGEREAIALAQTRRAMLLCNDRRAITYCRQQQVQVVSLVDLLRLLWVRQIVSPSTIRAMIAHMYEVEGLILTPEQLQVVFAPQSDR